MDNIINDQWKTYIIYYLYINLKYYLKDLSIVGFHMEDITMDDIGTWIPSVDPIYICDHC